MPASKATPITFEALIALGGVVENAWSVRFGDELCFQERGRWQFSTHDVASLEQVVEILKRGLPRVDKM